MQIYIANDGQAITETNYFDTDQAAQGYLYLSWNAGAARLLVPDSLTVMVNEMRTAKYVIVSRGPWPSENRTDALEILFEDHTANPFSLHMVVEQTDRLLPKSDNGKSFSFSVWSRQGELIRMPGKYRVVKHIPWLKPWK